MKDWFRFFEVNVLSGVRLSRHYFPKMLKKNWGRVLFISSESAIAIPSEMVHYGMTKTAQLAVARGMAEHTQGSECNRKCDFAGTNQVERCRSVC